MFYFLSEVIAHGFYWFDTQYWCYSIYLRDLDARHFARRFLERLKNPINNSFLFFLSIFRVFYLFNQVGAHGFFGLIHSIGVIQYICILGARHFAHRFFMRSQKKLFPISLFLRCFHFHILLASKRES